MAYISTKHHPKNVLPYKNTCDMLLTLEIDEYEADEFLQAVRLLKGFRKVKEAQTLAILPTQPIDIRTLCLDTPFLTSKEIDEDINNLRNEWENDI